MGRVRRPAPGRGRGTARRHRPGPAGPARRSSAQRAAGARRAGAHAYARRSWSDRPFRGHASRREVRRPLSPTTSSPLTTAERAAADREWAFGHVDRRRGAGAVADGLADADAPLPDPLDDDRRRPGPDRTPAGARSWAGCCDPYVAQALAHRGADASTTAPRPRSWTSPPTCSPGRPRPEAAGVGAGEGDGPWAARGHARWTRWRPKAGRGVEARRARRDPRGRGRRAGSGAPRGAPRARAALPDAPVAVLTAPGPRGWSSTPWWWSNRTGSRPAPPATTTSTWPSPARLSGWASSTPATCCPNCAALAGPPGRAGACRRKPVITGPICLGAVDQDQVPATRGDVQPGPRDQRRHDPVVQQRRDRVVVAREDQVWAGR